MNQYRTVWRKSSNDNDRYTIWRNSQDYNEGLAEALRAAGHLVIRTETREINLTVRKGN